MNIRPLSIVSLSLAILLAAACAIHIPYGAYEDHGVSVLLHIRPDDAEVLLDGRFVGEAYEFASPETALELASRFHELVIRKAGYQKEKIALSRFDETRITLDLELKRSPEAEAAPAPTPAPVPAPAAKPEPLPETAASPAAEKPPAVEAWTEVVLEVSPVEAAIFIDGKFFGVAPEAGRIDNLRLRPGNYEIAACKPGYRTVTRRLRVNGQKELKLAIELAPDSSRP